MSVPIWDTKSTKGVQIIEMSDDWSPVDGGKKMIILCERILKSDIKVNFFETDKSGNRTWEAGGIFQETDVHKQYGICFRTPPYRTDRSITTKVRVNVELQKLSDKHGRSDPLPFYYFPKTCSCLSPTTGRAYLPPPSDNCLPTCGRRGLQPRREDNVAQ